MQGDPRIDELMRPVMAAIKRHVKNKDAVTEIYNRAYEALMIMDVNQPSKCNDSVTQDVLISSKTSHSDESSLNNHEKLLESAHQIGSKFLSWTPETGPCPISINDDHWFKKLCGLFETQADLEIRLSECQSALISMVQQYLYRPLDQKTKEPCEAVYQHDFMSSGEEACDYLVRYELAEWTDEYKYAIGMVHERSQE